MTSKVGELARRVLNEVVHIDRQLSETAAIHEVDLVQSLISAVHSEGVAEGAEQMKEALRTRGQYTQRGDTVLSDYISPMAATRAMVDLFIIPASAFASVQKVRGKPSQALLDELSEICGGEVTYEPSVLAPTKESTYTERLRDSVNDIINGEDDDPTPD